MDFYEHYDTSESFLLPLVLVVEHNLYMTHSL